MALVSAFFLDAEHKAQEFGMLPTLLVLAGPLMHVFVHHGQDDGHRQTGRYPSEDDC
jgi:hypothetical protein